MIRQIRLSDLVRAGYRVGIVPNKEHENARHPSMDISEAHIHKGLGPNFPIQRLENFDILISSTEESGGTTSCHDHEIDKLVKILAERDSNHFTLSQLESIAEEALRRAELEEDRLIFGKMTDPEWDPPKYSHHLGKVV